MKKQTILAFTTALGIAMSVSAPVEAASANRVNISVYEKDCTTNQWNSVETGSINDVLKKICDRFPAIVLPGDCIPEIPEDDKEEQRQSNKYNQIAENRCNASFADSHFCGE